MLQKKIDFNKQKEKIGKILINVNEAIQELDKQNGGNAMYIYNNQYQKYKSKYEKLKNIIYKI